MSLSAIQEHAGTLKHTYLFLTPKFGLFVFAQSLVWSFAYGQTSKVCSTSEFGSSETSISKFGTKRRPIVVFVSLTEYIKHSLIFMILPREQGGNRRNIIRQPMMRNSFRQNTLC